MLVRGSDMMEQYHIGMILFVSLEEVKKKTQDKAPSAPGHTTCKVQKRPIKCHDKHTSLTVPGSYKGFFRKQALKAVRLNHLKFLFVSQTQCCMFRRNTLRLRKAFYSVLCDPKYFVHAE